MNYLSKYKDWLLSDYFDEKTRAELKSIEDDQQEIEDRFYRELKFGTGGIRGIIGAGTNRMNKYMVRKVTQGLANYIINYYDNGTPRGVVIAYDSRHKSAEFARETALVLCANGIKTYLFSELCPVPILSYAVRKLKTAAGVVVTASHNPSEYNGYKVYGADGGQVVPDEARKITAEIEEINDFSLVKRMVRDSAEKKGLLKIVDQKVYNSYREELLKVVPEKKMSQKMGKDLKIIYTPLHGTGYKPIVDVLNKLGIEPMLVTEQLNPDPDFSTVTTPNPEDFSSFKLALKKAEKKSADLIIATDPDCDRMGVVIKNEQGEYQGLNGNEIGVLLADFLLNRIKIPEKGVIIKTIVTTEMIRKIAANFGVELVDVLTGFKFIGGKIKEYEENNSKNFIFGFEESYGYLAGTYTRDKDAVVASALFSVMTIYYQQKGLTVGERLDQLRKKYGYYREELESIYLEGKEGQAKIKKLIDNLSDEKTKKIAGREVNIFKDYREGVSYNYPQDTRETIELPESSVLQYFFEDESLLTIRPSGTEPKLKIYFSVNDPQYRQAINKMKVFKKEVMACINDKLYR